MAFRGHQEPGHVGTGLGLGRLVDEATLYAESIPPDNGLIATAKFGISALKFIRDRVSTVYNFVCQQMNQEGQYHDLIPINILASDISDRWDNMATVKKALTMIILVAIAGIAFLLVFPK